MSGGHLEVRDLAKTYKTGGRAVRDISFEIAEGEFFSLLGPSGCGKTTTLRMIAGFEEPTGGEILIDGEDVLSVPAHKRNVNTVFQSYLIFPHLTVFENIAFGLRRQRCSKSEIKQRVAAAVELVQLQEFVARRPSQLSGGQQQRVALARALVLKPKLLLLDEPLGALDARLRRQLQIDLKTLQKQVGITFIYVTHDQEEALTMSDRIAVMHDGVIEQIGPPRAMYEEPATGFVADFLGVSNVLDCEIVAPTTAAGSSCQDACTLKCGEFVLHAQAGATDLRGKVRCVIRPERVVLGVHDAGGVDCLPGIVEQLVYVGSETRVMIRLATGESVQTVQHNDGGELGLSQGTPVQLHFPPEALRVLGREDPRGEAAAPQQAAGTDEQAPPIDALPSPV